MSSTASARALFSSLIDYAGLFPPAGLGMAPAVGNYARYLRSDAYRDVRWMLARFIVPAARLAEFEAAATPFWTEHSGGDDENRREWRVSALVGENIEADIAAIRAFNTAHADANRAQIDAIECKLNTPEDAHRIARLIPSPITAYLEFSDLSAGVCPQFLDAITKAGANSGGSIRAKIRTGGVKAQMIPAADDVLRFIAACAERKLAFKATAGLHHAVPGSYPLTYEPDAACGNMHGFLGLFLAAGALWNGADLAQAKAIFHNRDTTSLLFTHAGITWDGGSLAVNLTTDQIADFRQNFAIAFGSCSFDEPVADLRGLGWLG